MPRETIAQIKYDLELTRRRLETQVRDAQAQVRFAEQDLNVQRRRNDELKSMVNSRQVRVRELENERKRLRRELAKRDKTKTVPEAASAMLATVTDQPPPVYQAFVDIVTDPSMREVSMGLLERGGMTDNQMLLAGVGMNPVSRRYLNAALDKEWQPREKRIDRYTFDSRCPLVVGSGVHAAIFCAVFRALTGIKPVVLDKNRAGGVFAVSENPAFYLNSRNRPGPLSVPGDEFGALNVLPAAPVQPADLGGDEYLTNDALAWSVRMSLMMNATVLTGFEVKQVANYNQSAVRAVFDSGVVYRRTIVLASGLSDPNRAFPIDSDRYLTFQQFMGRLDMMFPFQGMKRVAVLGAGDSGKTVIEALTGQGPSTRYSVPSLDFVEKIDWFGVPDDRRTRDTWEACNRSRYKSVGRLLPQNDRPFRVLPLPKPSFADMGYDCVKIDGQPYDFVIDCTGFRNEQFLLDEFSGFREAGEGRLLARTAGNTSVFNGLKSSSRNLVAVGPAAKLPTERTDEAVLKGIGENATAIFLYADRTARVAQLLARD